MPDYLIALIKKYPEILSGRKNFSFYKKRIDKILKLTKKFNKKNIKINYKNKD